MSTVNPSLLTAWCGCMFRGSVRREILCKLISERRQRVSYRARQRSRALAGAAEAGPAPGELCQLGSCCATARGSLGPCGCWWCSWGVSW